MSYSTIKALTIIEVPDHKTLLDTWRGYDFRARFLIGSIKVGKPLTASQLRRLPSELRERLADNAAAVPRKPVASVRPAVQREAAL